MKFKQIKIGNNETKTLALIKSDWGMHYHIIYESPEQGDLFTVHKFGMKHEIIEFMKTLGFINEDEVNELLFGDEK